MAMFQLDIAFLLELALFAAGLVLLHLGKQGTAPLLRAAGFVLVVGSVLTAACSVYYGVRYQIQGEFESAYPPHHEMMEHQQEMMMQPGMMQRRMMRQQMMERRMGEGMRREPGEMTPEPMPMEELEGEHHPEPETER